MEDLSLPPRPSCPLCGSAERVERDLCGRFPCWLCSTCWTVFHGSADEWEKMRKARVAYSPAKAFDKIMGTVGP